MINHPIYLICSFDKKWIFTTLDLKAANCLLAEDGSIKIGDMNVSKVMKDGALRVRLLCIHI